MQGRRGEGREERGERGGGEAEVCVYHKKNGKKDSRRRWMGVIGDANNSLMAALLLLLLLFCLFVWRLSETVSAAKPGSSAICHCLLLNDSFCTNPHPLFSLSLSLSLSLLFIVLANPPLPFL